MSTRNRLDLEKTRISTDHAPKSPRILHVWKKHLLQYAYPISTKINASVHVHMYDWCFAISEHCYILAPFLDIKTIPAICRKWWSMSCWYCYFRTIPPNLERVHRCNQGITCWRYKGTAWSLSSAILRNMLCTCNENFNLCRLSQQLNHISCDLLCNHRIILTAAFLHIKVADTCTIFFFVSLCDVTSEYSLRTWNGFTDVI